MIERPKGVRVGRAPARIGEPRTVARVVPCEMVGVRYRDAKGVEREEVLISWDGKYFRAPNSREWMAELQPVPAWLPEAIRKKTMGTAGSAPTEDTVDVMEDVS